MNELARRFKASAVKKGRVEADETLTKLQAGAEGEMKTRLGSVVEHVGLPYGWEARNKMRKTVE